MSMVSLFLIVIVAYFAGDYTKAMIKGVVKSAI